MLQIFWKNGYISCGLCHTFAGIVHKLYWNELCLLFLAFTEQYINNKIVNQFETTHFVLFKY